MKTYAYLRCSTKLQSTDHQRNKIETARVMIDEWLVEHAVSGSVRALERPVFSSLIKVVEQGDTVFAVSLDRLGRDTEDVLHTIRKFHEKGVHLRLMDLDGVDLTSQTGKLLTTMMSLMAEFERGKCIERTASAVANARSEGKVFGRYLKVAPDVLATICEKRSAGATLDKLEGEFGIGRTTLHQVIGKWKDKLLEYGETYHKQQQQKIAKDIKSGKEQVSQNM